MSGLDAEQLDELEYRVAGLLEEPWDKGEGRPRELTLREALVVTCGYIRQNIIEDVGGHLRRRPVDNIAVHHVPDAIRREGDRGRPAVGRRCSGGHQRSDRAGRWHAVAVLVLGRREQAVVREVLDHGTWVPGGHKSSGPQYFRL